ncbi:hypothetical protein N7530_004149 [Penicillium desertorum]|uniref:DUF7587 domain-containing protein n=1 Tax=Penicillium desertorum TaxID=1303715 RepID=A0A9X0BQ62_9EURO|nr:hypothetical protein N7530_004149 [Penicillium desertorum]
MVTMVNPPFYPLRNHEVPWILFRTSCDGEECDECCEEKPSSLNLSKSPESSAFDSHLSWKKLPTPFVSFFSTWARAMRWREWLEENHHTDIKVVALWARDMGHVYKAMTVALSLGYSDTGSDNRRNLRNHEDEYLIGSGVDEDRILAVFRGGGDLRAITFDGPFYKTTTSVPSEYFPAQGIPSKSWRM